MRAVPKSFLSAMRREDALLASRPLVGVRRSAAAKLAVSARFVSACNAWGRRCSARVVRPLRPNLLWVGRRRHTAASISVGVAQSAIPSRGVR